MDLIRVILGPPKLLEVKRNLYVSFLTFFVETYLTMGVTQFIENHFVEAHCLNYLNHFVKITLLSVSLVLLLMTSKPQGLVRALDWTEEWLRVRVG